MENGKVLAEFQQQKCSMVGGHIIKQSVDNVFLPSELTNLYEVSFSPLQPS